MKMLRSIILGAFACLALALPTVQSAHAAAGVFLCAPEETGKPAGPRQVTNPNTSNTYSLNQRGCGLIASGDVQYFQSQGFTVGANLFSIAATAITAQNFASLILPPGAYVHNIVVQNTTANAVTGGIKVGTSAGGTDVVAALTCAGNCYTFVADTALLKRVFSTSAPQTLSIDAVTGFNSSSLDVTVFYSLR